MKAGTENVAIATKYLIFWSSSHHVSSFTSDVTTFVKGAQNAQFSFRIFSQDSETLESHISETDTDINKQ